MKKFISMVLVCGLLTSSAAVFAEDIALTAENSAYSVTVNGGKLDLGKNTVFTSGKQTMLPLRVTAEKLGFKVTWDGKDRAIKLDNGEVNTRIHIGTDSYYMVSSTAIGMSAPTALGAAPNIEGMELSEIRKEAGYDFKIPFYIPQGYEMNDTSLMFGSMVQISYEKDENRLIYRTDNTSEDISGDYNVYENTEEKKIGGADVTVKGNDDKYNSASWNDTNAYSVYSDEGLDKSEMIKIIESTDYPSFDGETENNGEAQTEN